MLFVLEENLILPLYFVFFLINTILVVSSKIFFFSQNSNYINCLKCTLKNKIDNKNEWDKIILHERATYLSINHETLKLAMNIREVSFEQMLTN